jgi:hypothetical protein
VKQEIILRNKKSLIIVKGKFIKLKGTLVLEIILKKINVILLIINFIIIILILFIIIILVLILKMKVKKMKKIKMKNTIKK